MKSLGTSRRPPLQAGVVVTDVHTGEVVAVIGSLDPVFGEVVEGLDVVDKIGKVRTDSSDRPKVPVRIEKAEVLE